MLNKKNPVLTGFHPDPTRLPCAKGDSPARGNVAKRQKGSCLGKTVSLLTEGLENRMEELY